MKNPVFVARERELAQLDRFLKLALEAQGVVCFVTGEAGSGKTALITEFARRAQEKHEDLVVAVGQSDAQTGAEDAYLPFREVLGQLTGDVEAKLAQGAITEANASLLRKLLVLSGQALVEVGPDLIGILVPGAGLAARVGSFAAEKVGWLEKLERLARKEPDSVKLGNSGIQQSHIFEQYANVLGKLSAKHPLLLVLDDLHWADAASIGLLFRLARRVGGRRILVVGTYRPEEVAIGRSGERHPLEKVLAELKRYYGDIWVDLNRADQIERRHFIDAFLNSEPNHLVNGFSQKLFQHTSGHALFTIELLRTMQERGDLVQDEQGYWVETSGLDWESLPKRVEGVIEERIGRLERDLRQTLTVGSVEGEDFTAEIMARVQGVEVRRLINRLSTELERKHHLVSAKGVSQLGPVGQRLSLYRFHHNLFQKYLYNNLDKAERAYLHEDVGNALEELYGDQVEMIVVQLARHFEEAGIVKKARSYLQQAGRQAAIRFANDEAIAYFSRALDLMSESKPEERYALLLMREQVYNLLGKRELQELDIAALQDLVQILDDDQKRAEASLRRAKFGLETSDYSAAVAAAQKTIHLAVAANDPGIQAVSHWVWGIAALWQGDVGTAQSQLEQALILARAVGSRLVEASSLSGLGAIADDQGDYDLAFKCYEESLHISREDGDRRGESKTLNNLGVFFGNHGDWARARGYMEQIQPIFQEMGDRRSQAVLFGNLGFIVSRLGDLQAAKTYFEQSHLASHEVGDRENESLQLGNLGGVMAGLGDLSAARYFREQALLLLREIGSTPTESLILNDLSHTMIMQGDYSAAGRCCEQSLHIARELGDRRREAKALGTMGIIRHFVGDYADAQHHYDASLQIAHSMGLQTEHGNALANLGLLHHHLGNDEVAQEYCQHALEIARETGERESAACALTRLGHAMAGLGNLAGATEAYLQSLTMWHEAGQHHMAMEPIAGLARVCLMQEKLGEAQTWVERIITHLESRTLEGTDEPLRVYLTCYRVMFAIQDPRAIDILNAANNFLQDRAGKIADQDMRLSYLEDVEAHRQILQEYAQL